MTEHASSRRYTAVAIALHWAIALAILSLIPAGWFMSDLPNGSPLQEPLYQLHKSVGITVLILTLARIGWRMANPPPPLPDDMKPLEKSASHLVHVGFYGLMLLMPLTGWLLVSTSYQFQVPTVLYGVISWPHLPFVEGLKNESGHSAVEFAHSKLAWVAIALVVLHVGGALKHEFSSDEGVLKRMIPALFGKTEKPDAARGAFAAFGGALIVFAAVAFAPAAAQLTGGSPSETESTSTIEANWAVDYEASEIRFSGVHDGDAFSGVFEDWEAAIAFYPDDLSASSAEVSVRLTSARTGTKLHDDSLSAGEWFDTRNHPSAKVVLQDFEEADGAYTATARLTLKDVTVEAPLRFTLEIDGEDATASGEAEFTRSSLDLGQSSDPNGDWVSETIKVGIDVKASRTE